MGEKNNIENKLERIELLLRSQALNNKITLNIDELVLYTGFSKLYIYKLTSKKKIPYYAPNGKKIFFKKDEIDNWLLDNRISTLDELREEALNIKSKKS